MADAEAVTGAGDWSNGFPGLPCRAAALGGRVQGQMVRFIIPFVCLSTHGICISSLVATSLLVFTDTHSTARPLKSRFLEAAYIESVRLGQLEVVEVDDLALASLERVLVGKVSFDRSLLQSFFWLFYY